MWLFGDSKEVVRGRLLGEEVVREVVRMEVDGVEGCLNLKK